MSQNKKPGFFSRLYAGAALTLGGLAALVSPNADAAITYDSSSEETVEMLKSEVASFDLQREMLNSQIREAETRQSELERCLNIAKGLQTNKEKREKKKECNSTWTLDAAQKKILRSKAEPKAVLVDGSDEEERFLEYVKLFEDLDITREDANKIAPMLHALSMDDDIKIRIQGKGQLYQAMKASLGKFLPWNKNLDAVLKAYVENKDLDLVKRNKRGGDEFSFTFSDEEVINLVRVAYGGPTLAAFRQSNAAYGSLKSNLDLLVMREVNGFTADKGLDKNKLDKAQSLVDDFYSKQITVQYGDEESEEVSVCEILGIDQAKIGKALEAFDKAGLNPKEMQIYDSLVEKQLGDHLQSMKDALKSGWFTKPAEVVSRFNKALDDLYGSTALCAEVGIAQSRINYSLATRNVTDLSPQERMVYELAKLADKDKLNAAYDAKFEAQPNISVAARTQPEAEGDDALDSIRAVWQDDDVGGSGASMSAIAEYDHTTTSGVAGADVKYDKLEIHVAGGQKNSSASVSSAETSTTTESVPDPDRIMEDPENPPMVDVTTIVDTNSENKTDIVTSGGEGSVAYTHENFRAEARFGGENQTSKTRDTTTVSVSGNLEDYYPDAYPEDQEIATSVDTDVSTIVGEVKLGYADGGTWSLSLVPRMVYSKAKIDQSQVQTGVEGPLEIASSPEVLVLSAGAEASVNLSNFDLYIRFLHDVANAQSRQKDNSTKVSGLDEWKEGGLSGERLWFDASLLAGIGQQVVGRASVSGDIQEYELSFVVDKHDYKLLLARAEALNAAGTALTSFGRQTAEAYAEHALEALAGTGHNVFGGAGVKMLANDARTLSFFLGGSDLTTSGAYLEGKYTFTGTGAIISEPDISIGGAIIVNASNPVTLLLKAGAEERDEKWGAYIIPVVQVKY